MGLSALDVDMSWAMKSFMLKVSEAKGLARTSYNFYYQYFGVFKLYITIGNS